MKILNKQIFYLLVGLIIALTIFSLLFRDFTGNELLSSMIALAVAAVPEGLPAVLSIILSVGVGRMAQKDHYQKCPRWKPWAAWASFVQIKPAR